MEKYVIDSEISSYEPILVPDFFDWINKLQIAKKFKRPFVSLGDTWQTLVNAATLPMVCIDSLPIDDEDAAWNCLTKSDGFRKAVWSNQRIVFISGFDSYMAFLTKIVCAAAHFHEGTVLKIRHQEDFESCFAKYFSKELIGDCFSGSHIQTLMNLCERLSDVGEPSSSMRSEFGNQSDEGKLHIMPKDNQALFSTLSLCVRDIAAEIEMRSG